MSNVVRVEERQPTVSPTTNPAALLQAAIERGIDTESLTKLLALQERWEANEARKAYSRAFAEFRASPPRIEKNKEVKYGNTKYSHATLDQVATAIGAAMAPHGLSFRWETKQENGQIIVTCWVSHVDGHHEGTTLSAGADTSGQKNSIQAIGSAVTYLQRYTLLAATGLATTDQDDDADAGASQPIQRLNEEQVHQIRGALGVLGTTEAEFMNWAMPGVPKPTVESIHASQYNDCMAMLRKKYKQQQSAIVPEPEVKF